MLPALKSVFGPRLKTADKCVLCIDTLLDANDLYVASCRHTFHYSCVARYVENNPRKTLLTLPCPLCRAPVFSDFECDEPVSDEAIAHRANTEAAIERNAQLERDRVAAEALVYQERAALQARATSRHVEEGNPTDLRWRDTVATFELYRAIHERNVERVYLLLFGGAEVNDDVLNDAFLSSDVEVIRALVRAAASSRYDLRPSLINACGRNMVGVVMLILENGVDVNYENGRPLLIASAQLHLNMVRLLLAAGANMSFEAAIQAARHTVFGLTGRAINRNDTAPYEHVLTRFLEIEQLLLASGPWVVRPRPWDVRSGLPPPPSPDAAEAG